MVPINIEEERKKFELELYHYILSVIGLAVLALTAYVASIS